MPKNTAFEENRFSSFGSEVSTFFQKGYVTEQLWRWLYHIAREGCVI